MQLPSEEFDRDRLRVLTERLRLAEDRTRAAHELHDVVIQRLFGMGLRLERLRGQLPEAAADELSGVTADLDGTIDDIRATIYSLRVADESPAAPPDSIEGQSSDQVDPSAPRPEPDAGAVLESIPDAIRLI